ncbi:hypothetical protein G6F40_015423 [Rhizopus arrhizus]|nr:hypothetical protein G6F40_015423 [Rhizopus arrhizus]
MARRLAEKLREPLKQNVIVEHRSGAGGNIGSEYVASAKPDGYTLLFGTSGPLAINLRAHHPPGPSAQHPGREPVGAGQQRARAHRLRQEESGQAQLRLVRQWRLVAPGRHPVQQDGRHADHAYPLQGHRTGIERSAGRAGIHVVHRHPDRAALHQGGQAARHRPGQRPALGSPARPAHLVRPGPQGL